MLLLLGIPDYITRALQAVSRFETVVGQIQENERDIESRLQTIAMANLLKFPIADKSTDLPGGSNQIVVLIENIFYTANCITMSAISLYCQ